MKVQALLATAGLMIVGCTQTPPPPPAQTGKPAANAPAVDPAQAAAVGMSGASSDAAAPAAGANAVALKDGVAELGPENSKVIFVGAHTGEKPDPRTGGFEKFSGKLTTESGKLTAVSFEISTDSMWTEIGGKLTTHLKSPDFLDSKEFPEIKFQSTKVESGEDGKTTITGDLTMHGETKSITIPANVKISDAGIALGADFKVDRAEFGMFSPATEKVEKVVDLKVVVGEKTEAKPGPAE